VSVELFAPQGHDLRRSANQAPLCSAFYEAVAADNNPRKVAIAAIHR